MSKHVAIFKHIKSEGAGTIYRYLRRKHLPYRIYELQYGVALPDLNELLALVVLGGPMNVDEEGRYPFLGPEKKLIRQAVQAKLPVLGVCLGAQLLATAFGAAVTRNRQPEVGWFEVDLTPAGAADPLFTGVGPTLPVVQWHQDTFGIPDQALHLASSPLCVHQALRVPPFGYGLQFHVEVTASLLKSWCKDSPPPQGDGFVSGYGKQRYVLTRVANRIYDNFFALI